MKFEEVDCEDFDILRKVEILDEVVLNDERLLMNGYIGLVWWGFRLGRVVRFFGVILSGLNCFWKFLEGIFKIKMVF